MNTCIYILVENFSNSKRESFFEKELPYISKVFKKVYVIPLYDDGTPLNFTASNVQVLKFDFFQPCNRIRIFTSNCLGILGVFFFELAKTHNKRFYIKNLGSKINELTLRFSAANNFEKLVLKDMGPSTVFYAYWFMQWMSALSITKRKYADLKIVSRVHGADYDEDQVKSTLSFRYFQLDKVNRIFPVSYYAANYLQNKFRVPKKKIEAAHLGLLLNERLAPVNNNKLHLVSCSSLIPLKRVYLIIEILKHIKQDVMWTHFGDGPMMDQIRQKVLSLPATVSCQLKGHVSNQEFITYIKGEPISFFVNVSESEGIPVTMMEAISMGIPLIGTNICGVPEIVCKETGFLIDKDFDVTKAATLIVEEHSKGKIYSNEFRKGVQQFYKGNFYAPENYQRLAQSLVNV